MLSSFRMYVYTSKGTLHDIAIFGSLGIGKYSWSLEEKNFGSIFNEFFHCYGSKNYSIKVNWGSKNIFFLLGRMGTTFFSPFYKGEQLVCFSLCFLGRWSSWKMKSTLKRNYFLLKEQIVFFKRLFLMRREVTYKMVKLFPLKVYPFTETKDSK